MNIETLILRRCYPVPVTFADLRAAAESVGVSPWPSTCRMEHITGNVFGPQAKAARVRWTAALKEQTDALDEVYAVVDGREVRVAIVNQKDRAWGTGGMYGITSLQVADLLDAADRAGYWEHPHEVRVELEERLISHDEVARAVMVGQQYVERKAVRS